MMQRVKFYISYTLKIGTLVSTSGLIASVLIQIYGRFFMENAPPWTEEASRIFFIYAISFAAGLAYQQNYFVSLDLISDRLTAKQNLLLEKAVHISIFALFLIMAIYSIKYIQIGFSEYSPSLGINMAVSFSSMLLLAASICFFSGIKIIQLFRSS